MNLIRAIRRPAEILPWPASVVLASLAAAPAALATPRLRPPGWNKHPPVPASTRPALRFPPGWNKHPPLPAHVHAAVTGGIPGWQITLIAAVSLLAAAALVVAGYRVRAVRRRETAGAASVRHASSRPTPAPAPAGSIATAPKEHHHARRTPDLRRG